MPLLHNRIEIDETKPLPDYDGPFAKAYAAKSKGAGDAGLLALVSTSTVATRSDLATPMRSLTHGSLMRLKDSGAIEWPPTHGRAFAYIYDRPPPRRLSALNVGATSVLREEPFVENIIKPLFSALHDMSRAGLFHGAVCAENIYVSEGPEGKAILGDALAQPAGFGQPTVYETIERGMADGLHRGSGTSSDDIYALGVALLSVMMGEEPLRGVAPAGVVSLKLERGSYTALAGERRFSPALMELLRGVMADDVVQRWTFNDFEMWAEGRRLTPKQSMAAKKASRPLPLGGQNYMQPRQLALAMAQNIPNAAQLIQSEELSRWLAHGLHDEVVTKNLEDARAAAKRQRGGLEQDRTVTTAIAVLDPTGPIRYRGISVFPSGLAISMADAALNEIPLQPFAEIIVNDFPTRWLADQHEKKPDIVGIVQQIERQKDNVEKPGLGFGPERAIYELCPTQPCLALALRGHYAVNIQQLLEGLDKHAAASGSLIDRHVAAFILTRDKKTMPQVIRAVETAVDPVQKGLALLTLFGDLQYRHGPDKLRGIARMLLPMADEVAKRFQNRQRQGKIRESLRPVMEEGNVPDMMKLVDDPNMLQLDQQEYHAAQVLYEETEAEIARLSSEGSNRKLLAEAAGQPLAAILSVGLAFVLAVYVLLRVLFL
jgi:hypothetical protein